MYNEIGISAPPIVFFDFESSHNFIHKICFSNKFRPYFINIKIFLGFKFKV